MLHRIYLLIICLSAIIAPLTVYADHVTKSSHSNHIQLPLTQDSAAELIHNEMGGKVLSVDSENIENETFYRVKVISKEGRVKIYRVVSSTGKIVD